MECESPPKPPPLPDSPPVANPHTDTATAIVPADNPAGDISRVYVERKASLEKDLNALHLERAHAIQRQLDTTYIDETIGDFEQFMCEQLTELENILRSQHAHRRKKVSVKSKKSKKRGVEDTTVNPELLRIELVPDKDGEFALDNLGDGSDANADQPTKKRAATTK
jgi:hypothetical protein